MWVAALINRSLTHLAHSSFGLYRAGCCLKISSNVFRLRSLIMQDGINGPGQRSGFICMRPSPCDIYQKIGRIGYELGCDNNVIFTEGYGECDDLRTMSKTIKEAASQRSTACALASVGKNNNFRWYIHKTKQVACGRILLDKKSCF